MQLSKRYCHDDGKWRCGLHQEANGHDYRVNFLVTPSGQEWRRSAARTIMKYRMELRRDIAFGGAYLRGAVMA